MGMDNIGNKAKDLAGKAKESLGDATDNRDMQRDGAKDRTEAQLSDAQDKAKDGVEDLKAKAAGAVDGATDRRTGPGEPR